MGSHRSQTRLFRNFPRFAACLRRTSVAAALFASLAIHAGAASLINRKAPEIARRDLNGQSVSLARLRGKVVLLNFWATWCAPCQAEMPTFAEWQRQYGPQGLQTLGISMDDNAAPVRKIATRLKVDYPIAMGDAQLGTRYGGVLGLPATFLIDRNGIVRAQFQGESDLKKIEAEMKKMLQAR